MNYRNFNQNQIPAHFNALAAAGQFNSMQQIPPRRDEYRGQLPQTWREPQYTQSQFNPGNDNSQQFGMGDASMFDQNRGVSGPFQGTRPGQFYQNQYPPDASQLGGGYFDFAPDREPFNNSREKGAGFSQAQRQPSFYDRQYNNHIPEISGPWHSRSRSRSPRRSLSSRRMGSPRRCLSRGSPPYRRTPSSEPMRSPSPARGHGSSEGGIWRPMVNLSNPDNHEQQGDEFRAKRRKLNPSDLPPLGQPGGEDDLNRKNLGGARTKWYLRYLEKGFHPDEAVRMAREPKQPAANFLSKDEHSLSWELPNEESMLSVEPCVPVKGPEKRETDSTELRVCLVPKGYPKEKLSRREKLDLEEAILHEVVIAGDSSSAPLSFTSTSFKSGRLELHCANQTSVDWLMNACGHFSMYKGRPVEPQLGYVKPAKAYFYVTVFLPRCEGNSNEFVLGLIRSQNKHNTNLWKLQTRKDQPNGTLLVLRIDQGSAREIAANDYTIFYRYGKIPVHGLRRRFGDKSPPRPPKPPRRTKTPKTPKVKPLKPVKIEDIKCNLVPKKNPDEESPSSSYCINLASDDDDVGN